MNRSLANYSFRGSFDFLNEEWSEAYKKYGETNPAIKKLKIAEKVDGISDSVRKQVN